MPHYSPILREVGIGSECRDDFPMSRNNGETWGISILTCFHALTFLLLSVIFRNMSRAAGFAGVILAAGESSRMGRDKALLPWPPVEGKVVSKDSFLSAAIRSLADATD